MDRNESASVKRLEETVYELRRQVTAVTDELKNIVTALGKKVDEKHVPISLEKDILSATQAAINEGIKKVLLDNYNSPLTKLVFGAVSKYSTDIDKILSDAMSVTVSSERFKSDIHEALSHKVARSILSVTDGEFDKVINVVKQNPEFRAKALLMLTTLVKDFTEGAKSK
jgi:hypothetical protein